MAGEALTLYDIQTGAPIQADAATAGDLVRSGRAGFLADQSVVLRGQDGQLRQVTGTEAADYLGSAEARFGGGGLGTAGELRRQTLEADLGGAGGMALAAGAGALRGASLGLSDAALVGSGLVDRQKLADLEEVNRGSSMLGEGIGMLAPVLLSGGSGGAAAAARAGGGAARGGLALRALGTAAELAPSSLVSALGRGVEGALVREGAGTLARIGGQATAAAVEGSLFGVGQAVSQATLRNEDLTAEKLVAAAGHGALLGGALGGGMGAAGALLRGGVAKAGEAGAGVLRRFEQQEGALAGELAAAAPKTEGTMQALASRAEREFALKSTGANQPQLQKLREELGEEIEKRVVRMVGDGEMAQALGKDAKTLLNAEQKREAAALLREQRGAQVGKMIDELGAAGVKSDVKALVTAERAKLNERIASTVNPDVEKAAKEVESWYQAIEKKAGSGEPRKIWETKHNLGETINWKAPRSDVYNELKKDLYFGLDREIQRLGAESAEQMGADFAARWANTNAEFRAADWLSQATGKGLARSTSNRNLGLSEQLGLVAGAAAGGGGLGGAALALGGAYVNHLAKVYGADVGMQLARAARQGEVVSTVERSFDQLLGRRASELVGAGRGALSAVRPTVPIATLATQEPTSTKELKGQFERRRDMLASFATNPPARIQAATAGLPPETAKAVGSVVQRAADFLQSKLPRRPIPDGLPPHLAKSSQPSPDEMAKFMRYARAIDDPLGVLEDAKKGRLSAEAMEAVKAGFPAVHEAIVEHVQARLAERKKPLTWKEETQLALLGIPVSASYEPATVRLLQQIQTVAPEPSKLGASAPPQPSPQGPKRPMTPPRLATRTDTLGAENV